MTSPPERGRLIAFEGVEGAGKSTQIGLLAASLRAEGRSVVQTREPGGTRMGAEMRRLLMDIHDDPPAPMAEFLLYLADRAQHVAQLIRPALERGEIVLTDRFSDSTLAYQGHGRGLDLSMVRRMDEVARQGVAPDLVLLLDCPVEQGLRRAQGDDRFHQETIEFHTRVRRGFHALAAESPDRFLVVDATADRSTVQLQVREGVRRCLGI